MGGDEWWLGSELRALLEAQAAEKAEQGCEKAACPTAAEAPEMAEKGPPAPAPAPVSAARRAPGAPWDDVDDALEAVAARSRWLSPAQAFALLRAERGRDARLAALPVRETASPADAAHQNIFSLLIILLQSSPLPCATPHIKTTERDNPEHRSTMPALGSPSSDPLRLHVPRARQGSRQS